MPANIFVYAGRQAAWHKLGTVAGHHMTFAEVQQHGLDYTVFKSQLRDGRSRPVNAWGTFRWNASDRADGNKEAAVFLGVVGEDYQVIQHADGFRTMDALVASVDGAHYETAGALGNGERVWGLADLFETLHDPLRVSRFFAHRVLQLLQLELRRCKILQQDSFAQTCFVVNHSVPRFSLDGPIVLTYNIEVRRRGRPTQSR